MRVRLLFSFLALTCLTAAAGHEPGLSREIIVEGTAPYFQSSHLLQAVMEEDFLGINFNGDRLGDLAIGSPRFDARDFQNIPVADSGAVNVLYGTAKGPGKKGNQLLLYSDFGLAPNASASFGASSAACDIDHDGFMEIIVGAPGAEYGGNAAAGVLSIYKGSKSGLKPLKQLGGNLPYLFLGSAVTCGDFDGDKFFDVAASGIGYAVKGKTNAGAVFIYKGPDLNLTATWHQGKPGIRGLAKSQNFFGQKLGSADINRDNFYDLIVGTPSGNDTKGFANIIYGSPQGLTSSGNQLVKLKNGHKGDFFSFSFAGSYTNDDDFADLTFGAPGFELNTGGAFHLYGSKKGLTAEGSFFWRNPIAKPGDKCGFSSAAIGIEGRFMFGFGCPGAEDLMGASDIAFFGFTAAEWRRIADNLKKADAEFGKSISFTLNGSNTYFLNIGSPKYEIGGLEQAGKMSTGKVVNPFSGEWRISGFRFLHRNNLKGENQAGAEFSDNFVNSALHYSF